MKIKYILTISIFVILNLASVVGAQVSGDGSDKYSECEAVKHAIDTAVLTTLKSETSTANFIFRRGRNETSRRLIARRMAEFRKYIDGLKLPKFRRYILAEAKSNNKLGTVEVFVEGRLSNILFAKPNKLFGYSCRPENS